MAASQPRTSSPRASATNKAFLGVNRADDGQSARTNLVATNRGESVETFCHQGLLARRTASALARCATGLFDPPRELTFEQDWIGHGWAAPSLITFRLTPALGGTLVELLHHGFDRLGPGSVDDHRGFENGWGMLQLEALLRRVRS
jgi:hypothetical protein